VGPEIIHRDCFSVSSTRLLIEYLKSDLYLVDFEFPAEYSEFKSSGTHVSRRVS